MLMGNKPFRRTKVLATTGPATDAKGMVAKLIQAGVNGFRINCSHGTAAERTKRVKHIRASSVKTGIPVAIVFDLQGPKIRIGRFKNDSVILAKDALFSLDTALGLDQGDEQAVGIDYQSLIDDVKPDNILLLDDGRIELKVLKITKTRIECRVHVGGVLSNNKGINLKGGGLSAKALTDKDKQDIKQAVELDIDFIAVSFVRSQVDLDDTRSLIRAEGGKAIAVIAKIERAEAIIPDVLDNIIKASDMVMVARGDLGVEIGDAQLPAVQKRIISRTRQLNKGVITATQMMESMIHQPLPTRAEIFDVANAVLDGTDVVMLSAETAVGAYPLEVIAAMHRTCIQAEEQRKTTVSAHRLTDSFLAVNESIAMASMYLVNHMVDIEGILALTESGETPIYMSRMSSGKPIFASSPNKHTYWKMSLYRGVYPILFDRSMEKGREDRQVVIQTLVDKGIIQAGDRLIVTNGRERGVKGSTNALEIMVA